MSLGLLWSLLNPIVMIGILSFVFTTIFTNPQPNFTLYILCGIVPLNFFSLAWQTATTSLIENSNLIKRVAIHREVVPLSVVLSHLPHLFLQLMLVMTLVIYFGLSVNVNWFWLPVIWGLEIAFVLGLSLLTSGVNVFVRDTRYIVESINLILFWFVPVFYSFDMVPPAYRDLYEWNPVAAVVMATRKVIIDGQAPPAAVMLKLGAVTVASLVFGEFAFHRLKSRFYQYL
jgi:ABC-type polysaccharide/polyol phosphate export permease